MIRVLQKRDHGPVVLGEDEPCVRVPYPEHVDASPEKGVVVLRQPAVEALEAAVLIVVTLVGARDHRQCGGQTAHGENVRHDDVLGAVMDQPLRIILCIQFVKWPVR